MLSCLLALSLLAPPNLVHNGDFELPAPTNPPPGWAMWGASQYKDPANFVRDEAVKHSGAASLRVQHPANTAGYLVAEPAFAVKPQEGQIYTLALWARSDAAGPTSVGVTAYESVNPFVDAPSPGSWPLDVGTEWREYRCTFREGIDFFAARSRLLLVTLRATNNAAQARTVWFDDVSLTATPDPDPVRLVDEATLAVPPLDHGLQPGERWEVRVDPAVTRPTNLRVGGISFHRLVGWTGQPYDRDGHYTLAPAVERAIAELHLPMTRLYGVGHEPFGLEAAVDRAAELGRKVGVPLETLVLELEEQSANRVVEPADWARAARYSQAKGYGFRYWEVGNEVYSQNFNAARPMGQAFRTPDDYVAHIRAVSAAVKAVQPTAQLGLSLEPRSLSWGNYVLRKAAGSYDFLCPHFYSFVNFDHSRFEAVATSENYRQLTQAQRLLALARQYNPGRPMVINDTEWALHGHSDHGTSADDEPHNANVWGLLHRAIRLIYYARAEGLVGASSWQMLNAVKSPGFGILSQQAPDQRFLLYWLYYHFNRHLGPTVLGTSGTAPWFVPQAGDLASVRAGEHAGPLTPLLVTTDGRKVFVVAANASSERAWPCRLDLGGAAVTAAEAVVLTQPTLDSAPLLARREDAESSLAVTLAGPVLTFTAPPKSVVFVTAQR